MINPWLQSKYDKIDQLNKLFIVSHINRPYIKTNLNISVVKDDLIKKNKFKNHL